VLQHLHWCFNPERQLRVQLQCLTQEQQLALKSTLTQAPKKTVQMPPAVVEKRQCPTCKLHFKNIKSHMKVHLPKHPGEFTCDAPGCNFSSNSLKKVKSHKLNAHDLKRRQCHLCGMVLKHHGNKMLHLNKHGTPTEGLFRCLFRGCTKTMLKSELKNHMGQHSEKDEPTLECEHCGIFFSQRRLLVNHQDRHLSEIPGQLKCAEA
jgi:hypothetical protein